MLINKFYKNAADLLEEWNQLHALSTLTNVMHICMCPIRTLILQLTT